MISSNDTSLLRSGQPPDVGHRARPTSIRVPQVPAIGTWEWGSSCTRPVLRTKKTGACAPEAYFAKLFRPHRLTPGPGLRRESIWGREPSLAAAQIGPEISRSKLVEVPLLLRLRGRFLRCQRPAKSMRCGFLFISGGQKGHNGRIRHQSHKNECEKNIVHGDL